MEAEHKDLLQTNTSFLIENLDDVDGVLDCLVEEKIFNISMANEIRVLPTTEKKVRELLYRLPRRGSKAFQSFVDALRAKGETTCADRLTGAQGDGANQVPPPARAPPTQDKGTPMKTEHKDLLQTNTKFLIENLDDVDGVLDCLVEEKIFNNSMANEIRVHPTTEKKVRDLLYRLPRRGPKAFQSFVDALRAKEETTCADRLEAGAGGDGAKQVPPRTQASPDYDEEDLPATWPDRNTHPDSVKLIKCQDVEDSYESMKRIMKKNKMYPMLSQSRGGCYIVNNHDFSHARHLGKELSDRTGTDKDCEGLNKLFSQLGFQTVIERDLQASGMRNFLKKAAGEDHSKTDCLVVFVLSHGERGTVLGVDGEAVSIHEIKQQFNGHGCPSMSDKPKLIFIQACQGTKGDEGVPRTTTGSQPSDSVVSGQLNEQFQHLEVSDAARESRDASNAHMVVMGSTHLGTKSWRETDYGTWFIQAIIYVFKRFSNCKEFGNMMTKVNALVNKAETAGGFKQVSVYETSLLQDLYFFPGLYQEGDELKEYSPDY